MQVARLLETNQQLSEAKSVLHEQVGGLLRVVELLSQKVELLSNASATASASPAEAQSTNMTSVNSTSLAALEQKVKPLLDAFDPSTGSLRVQRVCFENASMCIMGGPDLQSADSGIHFVRAFRSSNSSSNSTAAGNSYASLISNAILSVSSGEHMLKVYKDKDGITPIWSINDELEICYTPHGLGLAGNPTCYSLDPNEMMRRRLKKMRKNL